MSDQNGLSNNVIRFPLVAVSAAAGVEGAGQLTHSINVVDPVGFDHVVTLPDVKKGVPVTVINRGTAFEYTLTVYAGSGGTIDKLAAGVPVKLDFGQSQTFWRTSDSPVRWQRVDSVVDGRVNAATVTERFRMIDIMCRGKASGNLLADQVSGFNDTTLGRFGISLQSCALGNGSLTFDSVSTKLGDGLSLSSLAVATGVVGIDLALSLNEPAADHTAGSLSTFETVTVGENVAFGDVLYLHNDGTWYKADANAVAKMPALRMAMATILAAASGQVLVKGRVRDDSWAFTVGGAVYVSAASVGIATSTIPSGTTDQVQILGYAYHANKMIFDPSPVLVEIA